MENGSPTSKLQTLHLNRFAFKPASTFCNIKIQWMHKMLNERILHLNENEWQRRRRHKEQKELAPICLNGFRQTKQLTVHKVYYCNNHQSIFWFPMIYRFPLAHTHTLDAETSIQCTQILLHSKKKKKNK